MYAVYDPVDGRCTPAAAGQPAPAVVPPDGTARSVELPPAAPRFLGEGKVVRAEQSLTDPGG